MRRITLGVVSLAVLASAPEASAQCAVPFGGFARFTVVRVHVIAPAPYFGPPTVAYPYPVRPPVIAPAPVPIPTRVGRAPDPLPIDEDKFLIVRPRDRNVAGRWPVRPIPEPAALPDRRPVADDPFVIAPAPRPDPERDLDRHLRDGIRAFASGQYARAAERFRLAVASRPDEPEARFALAQAELASGNYRRAVAEIAEGMRRTPDWPDRRFDPREMFADRGGFAEQVRALREAIEAAPDDPALLFLLGHQLWFTGDTLAAEDAFLRAITRASDPGLIETFLDRLKQGRLVRR